MTWKRKWNSNACVMYIDLGHLQGKPWHERMEALLSAAGKIAREYQSPLKNDAKGTLDCYLLEDKISDCRKILKEYRK